MRTMFLVCHTDMVANDGVRCCTNGSKYKVNRVDDSRFYITNDEPQRHSFSIDENDEAYFGQWFELVAE